MEMQIIDFLTSNSISWIPIALGGPTGKIPINGESYTDFKKWTEDEILQKQKKIKKNDYIAINTYNNHQLDCDTKETEEAFKDIINKSPYYRSINKKLPHIFCQFPKSFTTGPRIGYKSKDERNIDYDLLTGQWAYVKQDTIVYNASENIEDIDENTFNNYHLYKEKKVKKSKEIEEVEEAEEVKIIKPIEENILISVVNSLPISYIDDYDYYIKIGWIFYNENLTLDDYKSVSKRSHKYDEQMICTHWNLCKNKEKKLTAATLWMWLKETDIKKFNKLNLDRLDFWEKMQTINHKDIAKYFYNNNPNSYLWSETMGWYSLGNNNIWKSYNNSCPSGLKRHISDCLHEITMETKKNELEKYIKMSKKITDEDKQKIFTKKHQANMELIRVSIKQFGSSDFCNGVISFLPSFYELSNLEEVMDMNRNIFAFNDGLFDLKTCSFRDIQPQDYVSTTTDYPYPKKNNSNARKELEDFTFNLFGCNNTKKYLLKVLSSCLFGGNRWEEFYCFTGTGGNGKGVICDLLKTVFGNYYISVDSSLFTKPSDKKDQPVPALVEARTKNIMMTTEPESDDRIQGGMIKKMTGGDAVEARTLNSKHIFKYVPKYKVILQMNNIPKMTKIDGGIQRRMRIINFPFKFLPKEKITDNTIHKLGDPDVKNIKCKSIEWRDEFLLMLTEIYKTIKDDKSLIAPDSVNAITNDYIDDNNPVKNWLNTYYMKTNKETDKIKSSKLLIQFIEDDNKQITEKSFNELLEFNGIKKKRFNDGNYFLGLIRKNIEIPIPSIKKIF
jgi:P4 family phage/plasmid primase-like protien